MINKDIMDTFYSFVIFSTLPGINYGAGGNTDMKRVGLFYCFPGRDSQYIIWTTDMLFSELLCFRL